MSIKREIGKVEVKTITRPVETSAQPQRKLAPRARRVGSFRIPADLNAAPPPSEVDLARRYQQHLKGLKGANKRAADPDADVLTRTVSPRGGLDRPGGLLLSSRPGSLLGGLRTGRGILDGDDE